MSGTVSATHEKVQAPSGAIYVNLVITYTRPDGREFSLKLDPVVGEDLILQLQKGLPEAIVARQEAIAETAHRRASEARQRLSEGAK